MNIFLVHLPHLQPEWPVSNDPFNHFQLAPIDRTLDEKPGALYPWSTLAGLTVMCKFRLLDGRRSEF